MVSQLSAVLFPSAFYKAIETAHNTTEQKQGWEGIEEATEMDSPARPSAHTLLTEAHMYISVGWQNISSIQPLSGLRCLQRPRTPTVIHGPSSCPQINN